jgi:proteic killer suppression protein
MIISFKDKETEKVWNQIISTHLPVDIQKTALRKLFMLNHAQSLTDLMIPPSNKLEKLKGDMEGKYSIRINNQWRLCFDWIDNNAYNVEITDYH